MKLNGHAARLALLFQIMKWAVGEADMQYVELFSVKTAIRMVDYYEETYRRIQEIIVSDSIGETKEAWLSLLGDTFSTGDAIVAGKKVEMSRRTVYYALEQLCRFQNPLIEKIHHGAYRKTTLENLNASCTIALSTQVEELQTKHSAKVHSANE